MKTLRSLLLLALAVAAPVAASRLSFPLHVTAAAVPPTTPTVLPVPATTLPPAAGYWHTSSTRILDTEGRMVRIAGVTWYGMESTYWVPAGLDYQSYTSIMDLVKHLGYNTIRLPYSDQLVEKNPIVRRGVRANPEFIGQHALSVMDAIVAYAQRIGLKIILDDHRSLAATPKRVNILDEALWYTKAYPQSVWIRDLRRLALRYRENDAVIGFDLRNEPHTAGPGPWDLHAYLTQGATWGPFKGVDNPATDWRLAAERAGNAVLAVNPHLLIFVEGVQLYPNKSKPRGVETYWWGSILAPVARYPVVLKVPHQLVYSAHDWGPRKNQMSWFHAMTYKKVHAVWYQNWSYLVEDPHASYAAPVWLGEFGTCTISPSCVSDPKSPQARWFYYLRLYLRRHPEVGWDFYALNGTNSNDHVAGNGLLNAKWNGVASAALQRALAAIQAP